MKLSFPDQLVDARNHSADSASEIMNVRALRFDGHHSWEPLLVSSTETENQ